MTNHVIDAEGGNLVSSTQIIQWQQKSVAEAAKQEWLLTVDGYIFNREAMATIDNTKVQLLEKKASEHSEQCWGFLLPTFGKCKVEAGVMIMTTETEEVMESMEEAVTVLTEESKPPYRFPAQKVVTVKE
ncbi:hypothetical protein BC936DRAFT_143612 [Jimgerdemannia flammicorona]|uniref:Uncharacterized protein n=1 Tax=Jimgerdemannia flammicorona TaxID=994334 RepID=A0A433DMH4_9FUNG|nr:hypothetical protein BC936DRAFT_143612 [Jimgerdemannia flammicorona]